MMLVWTMGSVGNGSKCISCQSDEGKGMREALTCKHDGGGGIGWHSGSSSDGITRCSNHTCAGRSGRDFDNGDDASELLVAWH